MAQSKVYPDAASALKGVTFDGMTVMSGGFGLSGNPENLITALKEDVEKLRDAAKNISAKAEDFRARADELRKKAAELRIDAKVAAKVAESHKKHVEKLQGKLEKLGQDRDKIRGALKKAEWVKNPDGTLTKTISVDVTKTVNGQTMTRKATIVRTINADKVLLSATADFDQSLPGGLRRVSKRSKTLNEDGSYTVIFHSEITLPNGTVRVAHWEKTISAEGGAAGTGKIEWRAADGSVTKTVTVALGGSDEAPTAEAEDSAAKTEAKVTVDEKGGVAAKVEDSATGETAEVKVSKTEDGDVTVAASTDAASVGVTADGDVIVSTGEKKEDGTTEVKADPAATAAADATKQ